MAGKNLKLQLYIFLFLLLILGLSVLILMILMDFIGIVDIKKDIPDQIKTNKFVKMYLDKAKTLKMTEEERIKYGIEKERKLIAQRKKMIEDEFQRFKVLQDDIVEEKKKMENLRIELKSREEIVKKLEKDFESKLEKFNVHKERIDKIVKLFEKMDLEKSAAIIQNLEKNLVVMIFLKIKVKTAARILSMLSPERAMEITTLIDSHKVKYSAKSFK
ncbi:hypothetical protein KAJ27_04735 [bacterium]|nr:hypothetical protein [bacterium]